MLHSRPTGDVLLSVARKAGVTIANSAEAGTWADYVKADVLGRHGADWNEIVRAGGWFEETQPQVDVTVRDVSPVPGACVDDGQRKRHHACRLSLFAFLRWPQCQRIVVAEVPDPVTAIAWTDWIEVHPETARSLGVRDGDTVVIESDHGQVEAACHVSNGIHPSVVAMPIGLRRGVGCATPGSWRQRPGPVAATRC
jgi:hypothetical protein